MSKPTPLPAADADADAEVFAGAASPVVVGDGVACACAPKMERGFLKLMALRFRGNGVTLSVSLKERSLTSLKSDGVVPDSVLLLLLLSVLLSVVSTAGARLMSVGV